MVDNKKVEELKRGGELGRNEPFPAPSPTPPAPPFPANTPVPFNPPAKAAGVPSTTLTAEEATKRREAERGVTDERVKRLEAAKTTLYSATATPAEKAAAKKVIDDDYVAAEAPELEVRTLVLDGVRKPENAGLRAAVSIVQEDMLEEAFRIPSVKSALDLNALLKLIEVFGPLIASIFKRKAPEPTPVPEPTKPPVVVVPLPPNAPPLPTPQPLPSGPIPVETVVHHIVGGRAYLTGATEGGPTGRRIDAERLRQIKNGEANAPHDVRFEFDFTPQFEDGHIGQPSGTNERPDYYFATTPPAPKAEGDTDGPMQVCRLRFDWEGPEGSSADLSREYAANGCTPRIRVKTGGGDGGKLSNLRFEFEGGAVAVEGVDQIFVGRGA